MGSTEGKGTGVEVVSGSRGLVGSRVRELVGCGSVVGRVLFELTASAKLIPKIAMSMKKNTTIIFFMSEGASEFSTVGNGV